MARNHKNTPDFGKEEYQALEREEQLPWNEDLGNSELGWLQAVCTLLPSRRNYQTQLRPKKSGLTIKRKNPLFQSLTLPRSLNMEVHPHVLISLQRQLSCASYKTRRAKSTRLSRHSFRFLQKATGLGDPRAADYIDFASQMASEDGLTDQEYLTTIRSLPVSMIEKRQVRAKLLQSPEGATGFSAWDKQHEKAKKRVKDLWHEVVPYFLIWNKPMKIIEGRYGTGVVSYFVFLRWLLYLNLAIFFMVFLLIVLPQAIARDRSTSLTPTLNVTTADYSFSTSVPPGTTVNNNLVPAPLHRWAAASNLMDYTLYECSIYGWNITNVNFCTGSYLRNISESSGIQYLLDFLQGTGWMEDTALFSGWYSPRIPNLISSGGKFYNLALAYISVTLVYFLLCLIMMVIYTTESVRESLKTSEGQLHKYCNLVFGGWDYCIEEKSPANRKHRSIKQEILTNLAEERRLAEIQGWSRKKIAIIYLKRVLANLLVLGILGGAIVGIYAVCMESLKKPTGEKGFSELILEFAPSLTVTAFNLLLPLIFGQIVRLESYATGFEIKITLIRTVFIRLASVVSLLGTIYYRLKIDCNRDEECNNCALMNSRCWETYVGQQVYKLVVMDFIVVFVTVFCMDFPRRLVGKHFECKFAKFVGHQEFDIPKNVLDLVYSQTLCWLGTYYSPLLPAICVLKFLIFFYIKKLTLMVNYEPSEVAYRASRSNTFFVIVLMLSFVLSAVPLGIFMSQIPPSKGCGPFRDFSGNMWQVVTCAVESSPSEKFKHAITFLTSPAFGVSVFIILVLAIYYYSTLSSANSQMVHVLKEQLVLEGKDKTFLLGRLTEVTKLHRIPS